MKKRIQLNHILLTLLLLGLHTQSFTAAAENPDGISSSNSYHQALKELLQTIKDEHFDKAKKIIDSEPGILFQKDFSGRTPLHHAIINGHLNMVEYIVEKDQSTLFQQNNDGETPLHTAAANGYLNIVQHIIEIDPSTLDQKNKNGLTPLHTAARNGYLKIIKYVAETNPNILIQKGPHGKTSLHIAVEEEHHNMMQYIIEKNRRTLFQPDDDGQNPLHIAAAKGCLNTVKHIIEIDRSTLFQQDNYGQNPLHIAVVHGCLNIVQHIIKVDPCTLAKKDHTGHTPLHHAVSPKPFGISIIDIVDFILQKCPSVDFTVKTIVGCNIVDLTPTDKKKELIKLLKNHLLHLHEINPDGQHIQCAICCNGAKKCDHCQNIANHVSQIHLLPCCLNVLCKHDFALMTTLKAPCPYCREIR